MARRRELLLVLVTAVVLFAFGAAPALAGPQWLPAESRDDGFSGFFSPDVATDADGNSVAIWIGATDQVLTAHRPRGGPWGPPVDIETAYPVASDPRVTVLPNGEFVAAWIADRSQEGDVVLRSATRSTAGEWTAETVRESCCEGIEAFEASGDGSVTVVGREDGGPFSNTRPPGSPTWGPRLGVPTGSGSRYAFGPDGSVLAANDSSCGSIATFPCVLATYLQPDGTAWGDPATVALVTDGSEITGLGVTAVSATAGVDYTVVWGEADPGDGAPVSPGRVRSADREPGVDDSWVTPLTVADLPADVPGCSGSGDCFDVAAGADGVEVAIWQQSGGSGDQMSAAIRGSGGAWGPVENAGDPRSGAARPHAVITSTQVPVAAWSSDDDDGLAVANGSHRDATGTWNPVELGSSQDDSVYLEDLAADGDGNALTAFRHRGGVFSAGFDGGGPRFSAFSLPSGGVGQALPFSAAADDNWASVKSISWLFGDGGGAPEASVSHAYGAGGDYTATATATDTLDNVTERSGTVAVAAAPTPVPTPTPDPCGTTDKDKDEINDACDTNDGSARPVAFKTVNATVVSGDVFVKLPAGSARAAQGAEPPKGFRRLQGAETIPVGSTLDTAKGRVRLRSASDTRKHVQTADFYRGRFVIRQVRKPRGKARRRSTKLITEVRLTGSSFSKACRTTTASVSAKRRSKKRVRRLFGDGKGSFRTRGRNAAATVRGTRWGVQDRCDGTLVAVQRGRVSVRDLVKRKTVIVRAGRTYLARRR